MRAQSLPRLASGVLLRSPLPRAATEPALECTGKRAQLRVPQHGRKLGQIDGRVPQIALSHGLSRLIQQRLKGSALLRQIALQRTVIEIHVACDLLNRGATARKQVTQQLANVCR
ncbi:hypothetical protein D3C85_1010780 [compost metagenome]